MSKRKLWQPLAISIVLLMACAAAYSVRPASLSALTIFPVWAMLPIPWLVTLLWIRRVDLRGVAILLVLSIVTTLCLSEEWLSLKRPSSLEAKGTGMIRVVVLNCAGGSAEAAAEVIQYHPDLVLFTESPGEADMRRIASQLWGKSGSVLAGVDGSVVTRGTISPIKLPNGTSDFTIAKVELDGVEINVVALRLMPPAFRPDIISPSAWSEVAQNAQARYSELNKVCDFVDSQPKRPTLMGGDFNAQPGSFGLRSMSARMRDAFYRAGAGWCHTAVNDYPLARIDQVWTSEEIQPMQMVVRKTINSDHRLVICDLEFKLMVWSVFCTVNDHGTSQVNSRPMPKLILVRHGQSLWNLEDRFTGWVDVPLTELGRDEARRAGERLRGMHIDVAYTSSLRRAQHTLDLILETMPLDVPIIRDEALNERHYGDLQGLNKAQTAEKFGKEQVHIWRRSYDVPPPGGESLEMTAARTLPFFQRCILGDIAQGKNVLVVAHGNSNRSIVMDLDQLDREAVLALNLGTAIPLVYELDAAGKVLTKEILE